MVDQRKDKRAPASLKVKYKSASVDQFVEQFSTDVSSNGIFLKTKAPIEVGALLKLELQLSDASPVIHGIGRVCWRRMPGPDPAVPSGMGIRFVRLDAESRAVVDRMIDARGPRASRFDQTDGAQVETEQEAARAAEQDAAARLSLRPSAATAPNASPSIPAAPAAPSPDVRPATLPNRPPGVAAPPAAVSPAILPRPQQARTGPAGLFADSPIARGGAAEARVGGPASDSFFPPAPGGVESQAGAAPRAQGQAKRVDAASASPTSHDRTSPARPSRQFPASAFAGGGATDGKLSPPRAFAEVSERPGDRDLIDKLFDDVVRNSARPSAPQPSSPAAVVAATTTSRPPKPSADMHSEPAPRSSRPLRNSVPLAARGSLPTQRSSAPSPTPFGNSEPPAAVSTSSAPPSQNAWQAEQEQPSQDYGEADIFNSRSSRAPATTNSGHPVPQLALQEFGASGKPSALVWTLLLLIAAGGGGGYYFYQQQSAAASDATKTAPAPTTPPPPAAAPSVAHGTAAAPGTEPPAAASPPVAAVVPAATAPAAAPAPGTVQSVQVEVSSDPRGAELLIDGNLSGTAPTRLTLPIGRTVQIAARSAGYAIATKTVTATSAAEPLSFALDPLPYFVLVRTMPAGATLEAGDRSATAPGPLELGHLDGVVNVSVSKPGFQRMTRPVRLDEFSERERGMHAEIDVSLSPLPGVQVPAGQAHRPKKPQGKPHGGAPPAAAGSAPDAPSSDAPAAAEPKPAAAPEAAAPAPAG
jgi:uncharacterized protein (TIGR02266 family)